MPAEAGQTMAPTRITADELIERMDRGEQFTILDTRNPKAWSEAETKLPGALRIAADELEKHLDKIPRDRTVITYCT
ncbi:MAG: rhodanese-like domain-containing protein [Acidobacteriota bacterium]